MRLDDDEHSRQEIQALYDDGREDELRDRLSSRLQFGTAGLRALDGPGFNRMNKVTVQQTTQGLCAYLQSQAGAWELTCGPDSPNMAEGHDYLSNGVVIGFDARTNSKRYAEVAAGVFLAQGIRVHLFPQFAATPVVACAVRVLGCAAGVAVTASHNPKDYNGYKVYYFNGCQIIPPHDRRIADKIDRHSHELADIPREVWNHPLCSDPTASVLPAYFAYMKERLHFCDRKDNAGNDRVVYTPLHGVGAPYVRAAFEAFGLPPPIIVPEQAEPDAGFPTVPFPNPEEGQGVWELAFRCGEREKARLIVANDPDADRLAVAERVDSSLTAGPPGEPAPAEGGLERKWKTFTGNEIGVLLAHWLWTQDAKARGSKTAMLTTVVSSRMLRAMGKKEGFSVHETLTGFKWLGNWGTRLGLEGWHTPFAYEEALGFSVGDLVRDKDGIATAAMFAEMAGELYRRGSSVARHLAHLRQSYGFFEFRAGYALALSPEIIRAFFEHMRSCQGKDAYLQDIGGVPVLHVRDLGTGLDTSQPDRLATLPWTLGDPFVSFTLAGDSIVTLRASGTEPKLKFYLEVCDGDEHAAAALADRLAKAVREDVLDPPRFGFSTNL